MAPRHGRGVQSGGMAAALQKRFPMTGVIQGGWEFVVAAYAISATVLAVYAISLFVRLRGEERR